MTVLEGSSNVMKALDEIARKMDAGSVEVGFLEGATYPDGTSVAAVAFWNEFGVPSRGQPPRPYFRQMISKESPTWPATMAALAKRENYNGERVLGMMGQDIKGALQQSINELVEPALAESTIKQKGFDKPLIGKAPTGGHMLNSIDYRMVKS